MWMVKRIDKLLWYIVVPTSGFRSPDGSNNVYGVLYLSCCLITLLCNSQIKINFISLKRNTSSNFKVKYCYIAVSARIIDVM